MKLTKRFLPKISHAVQQAAETALGSTLDIISRKGGCAFIQQDVLAMVNMKNFSFAAKDKVVHVPKLGKVRFSFASTYVSQPTTMDCQHVGFSGREIVAHIAHVPFSIGFTWSYHKAGSRFWWNHGNGSVAVVGGTSLRIDMLNPEESFIAVAVPTLAVNLDAEYHKWLYHALTSVLAPLVRKALQTLGSELLTFYIRLCLQDPSCPQLPGAAAHAIALLNVDNATALVV